MNQISVVICTHNPKNNFLKRVINSLYKQSLKKILCEFLIIDNSSEKPVEIKKTQNSPDIKIIPEKNMGLLYARLAGIKNSNGNLIAFIDDDNVLAYNYLEKAIEISHLHPNLGCFGAGIIEPEFEIPIPDNLIAHQAMLALRKIDSDSWSNNPQDHIIPWGAGLVVRREVALAYYHEMEKEGIWQNLGRNGNHLLSGEDVMFSWIACKMGYGKGLFVDLKLTHLIDRRRLNEDYFVKIAEGHAFSNRILDHINNIENQRIRLPYISLKEITSYLIKLDFDSFLISLYRLIVFFKKNQLDRKIAKARWRGYINADNFIKSNILKS